MFIIIKSWKGLNLGHVGSKTRSQAEVKNLFFILETTFFVQSLLNLVLAKQKKVAEKDAKKSELRSELASLRKCKRKLESHVEGLEKEANELAIQAKKKMKFDLLAKSNAFRSKATEHRKEIQELDRKIQSVSKNIEAL